MRLRAEQVNQAASLCLPSFAMLVTLSGAAAAAAAPIAAMPGGVIVGTTLESGVQRFLGVPFAAPPTGARRWQAPAPVAPWTGHRSADHFGADCVMSGPARPSPVGQSEDCLFLNVWAPAGSLRGRHLPVMMWIFGSGFRSGTATRFDGEGLARKGVVFVSTNYRQGALGFLASTALTAESPHHASGNYGAMDTIAALRWIRANIASFGGDPRRVTIFGQSSGSETVNLLTASPLAHGLFQRAVGESGGGFGEREPKLLAAAEGKGDAFLRSLGAQDAAGARALPAGALMQGRPPPFEPVVDGYVLPQDAYAIYAAGKQNDVPMIVGSNDDEAQLPASMTKAKYDSTFNEKYGAAAGGFLMQFGAATDADAPAAFKRQLTLLLGDFNTQTWAMLQDRTGHAPIYHYRFVHTPGFATPGMAAKGAFHGAEILYVMNDVPNGAPAADSALAGKLSSYWVNFASTGNPNGPGLSGWPDTHAARGRIMQFGDAPTLVPLPHSEEIDYLQSFFYGPGGFYGAR